MRVSDEVSAGPFGSARVRAGPRGSGRVRVVEFSYKRYLDWFVGFSTAHDTGQHAGTQTTLQIEQYCHLCRHSAFVALAKLRYINALNNNNNNNRSDD